METLSLTALRNRLYQVVDQVIKTGVPQEIERKGRRLKIMLDTSEPVNKLSRLQPHKAIVGDPDELIYSPAEHYKTSLC